jgi:hypothetical protein
MYGVYGVLLRKGHEEGDVGVSCWRGQEEGLRGGEAKSVGRVGGGVEGEDMEVESEGRGEDAGGDFASGWMVSGGCVSEWGCCGSLGFLVFCPDFANANYMKRDFLTCWRSRVALLVLVDQTWSLPIVDPKEVKLDFAGVSDGLTPS